MNITGANELKNKGKEVATDQRLEKSCESKNSDSLAKDQLVAHDSLMRENSPRMFQKGSDSLQLSRVSMAHEIEEDRDNIDEAYCCQKEIINNLDANSVLPQSSCENRLKNHASSCSLSKISEKSSSNHYESGDKNSATNLDNNYLKASPCAKCVSEPEDPHQVQELLDSKGDFGQDSGLNDSNCHETRTSRVLSLSEKKRILNVKDHIELIDLTRQHQSGQQGQLRRASPPLNTPVPMNLTPYHAMNYPQKYHEVQLNRQKIQRSKEYKIDASNVVTTKISENSQAPKNSIPNDSIDDSLSALFLKIPTHTLPPVKPISESCSSVLDIALKKVEDENKLIYSQCQNIPVLNKQFVNLDLKSHEMEEEVIRDHSERYINRYSEGETRATAVKNPHLFSTNAGNFDNYLKNDPLKSLKIISDEDFSITHGRPTKSKDSPVENFQNLKSHIDMGGDTCGDTLDGFSIEKNYISQGSSSIIIDSKTESPGGNQNMSEIHSRNDTLHSREMNTDNPSSPLTGCSIIEEKPSYAHIEYAEECTSDDVSDYIENRGISNLYRINQAHDVNGAEIISANPENENISDVYIREKYSYVRKKDSESICSHYTANPNLDEGSLSTHIKPMESNSYDIGFSNSSGKFIECAQNNFNGIQKGIPEEGNLVAEESPTQGQFMNSVGFIPQVYDKIHDLHGIETQHSNLSYTNFLDRPESSTQGIQRAESTFNRIGPQVPVKSAFSREEFKELHKRNMDMYQYNLELMDIITKATEEFELMQAQAQEIHTGILNFPVNSIRFRGLASDWQQDMFGETLHRNLEYGNPSVNNLSAHPTQSPQLKLGTCNILNNSYDQSEFYDALSYSDSAVENCTLSSDESAAPTVSENSVRKDKGKGKAISD